MIRAYGKLKEAGIPEFFLQVSETPFLLGENERGWRADLEWLLNPTNMAKVLEGKFKRVPRKMSTNTERALARVAELEAEGR
jgi:hypothetical protein